MRQGESLFQLGVQAGHSPPVFLYYAFDGGEPGVVLDDEDRPLVVGSFFSFL